MACCGQLEHYGFFWSVHRELSQYARWPVQNRLNLWSKNDHRFLHHFVSFWTLCKWRLQFKVETGSTSWSPQSCLLAFRNQCEHSKRHYSMSNNGPRYVNYARPNAAQPSGRVLTLCQWAFVWISDWNACEVEWFIKLKVPVLLHCRSALMEYLLSNQTACLEVTAV